MAWQLGDYHWTTWGLVATSSEGQRAITCSLALGHTVYSFRYDQRAQPRTSYIVLLPAQYMVLIHRCLLLPSQEMSTIY